MRILLAALGLGVLLFVRRASAAEVQGLVLPDSPRIAFIGNTFVERDQASGYFETRLILTFPAKEIVFRNVGWSGDTVRGEARAGFGQPVDGFNALVKQVGELKPDLIFLNYGLNESYVGAVGVEAFRSDLGKLLDALSRDGARIVIFSIIRQENLGPPLPDPSRQNENIRLYNRVLKDVAEGRKLLFVDLFDVPDLFAKAHPGEHFTDDEIHLTAAGYAFAGEEMARRLGLAAGAWDERAEKIRRLTVEKNRLYFHRWRPENETYIFGFRKHEQGRNAVEIPQFDPLVAEKEGEIARAKKD